MGLLTRLRRRWALASGQLPHPSDTLSLTQNRIYVLPSGRGLFIIVVALVLLLIAVNYQLALAYLVAFLLGGLMQVALHATHRNLAGLVVRPGRSPMAREGEPLVFSLMLVSPDRRREGVRAIRRALPGERGLAGRVSLALDLAAGQTAHLEILWPAGPRGVVPLGRITLESRAPYGLIRAWSYVHFDWVGLVHPQAEAQAPPLPHGGRDETLPGRLNQVAHDPDELREYVPGDSLKRVAWKQVAKSGDWYTRTGASAAQSEILIDWQTLGLSDSEACLRRMAAWIERARNENIAYALSMPNGQLKLADGAAQARDALVLLASYPQRPEAIHGLKL